MRWDGTLPMVGRRSRAGRWGLWEVASGAVGSGVFKWSALAPPYGSISAMT